MRRILKKVSVWMLLPAFAVCCTAQVKTPLAAGPLPPSNVPSDSNYQAHLEWNKECEARVKALGNQNPEIIFFGDSITQNWTGPDWGGERRGGRVWAENYVGLHALNFGVGADKTQNLLWRMDHMSIQTLHPKVAVLLIGVNNYEYSSQQIADGTHAVILKLERFYPGVKIILVSILPNRLAEKTMTDANAITKTMANGQDIFYLDLVPLFASRGDNWIGMGADHLHPNEDGYRIWADAMHPLLKSLLALQ